MKKYRPYLTLADLKQLVDLCNEWNQSAPLTLYLERYILDIDSGYRRPNSTSNPMAEKLGFVQDEPTAFEINQKARYIQGLMSPQEERDYETKQGRTV